MAKKRKAKSRKEDKATTFSDISTSPPKPSNPYRDDPTEGDILHLFGNHPNARGVVDGDRKVLKFRCPFCGPARGDSHNAWIMLEPGHHWPVGWFGCYSDKEHSCLFKDFCAALDVKHQSSAWIGQGTKQAARKERSPTISPFPPEGISVRPWEKQDGGWRGFSNKEMRTLGEDAMIGTVHGVATAWLVHWKAGSPVAVIRALFAPTDRWFDATISSDIPRYMKGRNDWGGDNAAMLWPRGYCVSLMKRTGRRLHIAEGYRDALALCFEGFPTVCLGGTQFQAKTQELALLARNMDGTAVLCPQNDRDTNKSPRTFERLSHELEALDVKCIDASMPRKWLGKKREKVDHYDVLRGDLKAKRRAPYLTLLSKFSCK